MDANQTQMVKAHRTRLQRCAVGAIGQEGGVFCELRETGNSKVFLVRVRGSDEVLSLECSASIDRESAATVSTNPLHSGQDVRLALIVPVSTNSKVDLAGVFVGLESLRDT